MRTRTAAFSFAAGLFLILLLPWSGWYLWAAVGVCLPALGLRLWAKQWRHLRRSQLILWPLAAAQCFTIYQEGAITAAGAGAVRRGKRLFRHGLRVAGGDGAGRQGHGAPSRLLRRQGCVLRRRGGTGAGAGPAAVRHGMVAGCRQHPGHGADAVHRPRRVRSAVPEGGHRRGRRQQGRCPVAAAAGRPCPAAADRRRLGRSVGAGLPDGGAYRRPDGASGGRRRGHAGDRACPSVRRVRPALRVPCDAAGAAGARQQTADALRRHHPGAAVLYGDGGPVAIGGAGLHHADLPADRAPAPPGQRRPDRPFGTGASGPTGKPSRRAASAYS